MSLFHGPSSISNGLVIYLDAGNLKSYPGSGSTWRDLTGAGLSATLSGSPTYSANNAGYIILNGSTQYATIAVNSFIRTLSTAYTFSSFFYYAANSGGSPYILMTSPNTGDNGDGFWQHFNLLGGNWLWRTEDTSAGELGGTVAASPWTAGQWYQLATVIKTNQILYYINGTLRYTISTTFAWANLTGSETANIYLGIGYLGAGATPSYYFNGYLSTFSLYSRELTSTEILQNYEALRTRFIVT